MRAPSARPISDEAAALAASTLAADSVGWRMFQWLQRSPIPDRSMVDCTARRVMNVNTPVDNFDAVIGSHGRGLLAQDLGLPSGNRPKRVASKVKFMRRRAVLK